MLNTLQYLIVDEILLARVMERTPVWNGYRDEENTEDTPEDQEDDTEYDNRKGRPVFA